MSKLLINEPPLQVLPTLAKIIGLNKAIFLQQIHYWLTIPKIGTTDDQGIKWVRNSIPEWRKDNFPFWSEKTVKRILDSLVDDGLIKRNDRLNKFRQDRTRWYTVDYELLGDIEARGQVVTPPKQGDNLSPPKGQPVTPQKDNLSPTLPETTPETTPEISPPGEKSPSGPNLTDTPQRDTLQDLQPSPSTPSSPSNPAFGDFQDDMVASIGRHTDQEMVSGSEPILIGDTLVDAKIINQLYAFRQKKMSLKQMAAEVSLPMDLISDIFARNIFYPPLEESSPESCICAALADSGILPPCSYCENSTEKETSDPDLTDDQEILASTGVSAKGPPLMVGDTLVAREIISQILELRYQEEMSFEQIAEKLSIPIELINDIFRKHKFYLDTEIASTRHETEVMFGTNTYPTFGDIEVSDEDVRQIHQLRQMGINTSQIGKKLNLPLDLINDILYGGEEGLTIEKETSDPTDILTELAEDEVLAGDDFADITAPRTDAKLLSEAEAAHLRTFGKFSGSELPGIYDIVQEIKTVWEIRNPTEELVIALFLKAIRTKRSAFAIPKNQGIRNDWIKSVRGHLQDYPIADLDDLYQRAITKLDQAGMTFSRPGSLTKTLPDVVDEPTTKTIVDRDGGFYI